MDSSTVTPEMQKVENWSIWHPGKARVLPDLKLSPPKQLKQNHQCPKGPNPQTTLPPPNPWPTGRCYIPQNRSQGSGNCRGFWKAERLPRAAVCTDLWHRAATEYALEDGKAPSNDDIITNIFHDPCCFSCYQGQQNWCWGWESGEKKQLNYWNKRF